MSEEKLTKTIDVRLTVPQYCAREDVLREIVKDTFSVDSAVVLVKGRPVESTRQGA